MSTLLLRLAGPMQSWGIQSRFEFRDTAMEPSKSGVVGLLCGALGRNRSESVDDLAALRMGVRVDREGTMMMDYHTAGGTHGRGEAYGVYMAGGKAPGTVVSRRYYLADADFLVGLEGDDDLLRELDRALAQPRWQLYLGRKAFPPGVPVHIPDGLRVGADLIARLTEYPWPRPGLRVPSSRLRPELLRLVLEADGSHGEDARRDQPVGAAFQDRRFLLRYVSTTFLELGTQVPVRED